MRILKVIQTSFFEIQKIYIGFPVHGNLKVRSADQSMRAQVILKTTNI
jgi:hypothetical protein